MSNIRLFFKESLSLNLNSTLDKSQSYYLLKVMRINIGKTFSLFNQSGEWEAKVDNINKGNVEFTIIKKIRSAESTKEICLAFAPIKLNYLNLMIQKATELGITKFIPILTDRTIVRKLNYERINKIIIEASEQSNRLNVPEFHEIIKFDEFIKEYKKAKIIFGDINSNNSNLSLKNSNSICILVGPEGDFTVEERNKILKLENITSLKVNENILRSETAALSMISIISFKLL